MRRHLQVTGHWKTTIKPQSGGSNPLFEYLYSNKGLNFWACIFELPKFNIWGAGVAQWLEHQTCDRKVAGSNPCWSGGRIFFSRVNFLCWLLFRYLFYPRVTAVARKRPQSFCQMHRWQVTAKHAYTLRMWLCMKWHGAWLYGVHRTCAETAAVSCGTSRASAVSTPLGWILKTKHTTTKTRYKKLFNHVEPHASAVSLLKRAENSTI